MIDFITCDEDIGRILRAPFASVISDSLYPTEGLPHPRVYGTFTRILETFVRERHVLTLPEAVQRMTALPAQALRLQGKGRIAAGMDADVNVFGLAAVHERATWEQPAQSRAWTPCSSAAYLPSCTEPLRARQTGRCCEENLRATPRNCIRRCRLFCRSIGSKSFEIHKVFLHFSNLASTKNLSPNALAELCSAAIDNRRALW
ncbi:MAG: amidohydrolase family protein [Oscillospiraceae bacterium]